MPPGGTAIFPASLARTMEMLSCAPATLRVTVLPVSHLTKIWKGAAAVSAPSRPPSPTVAAPQPGPAASAPPFARLVRSSGCGGPMPSMSSSPSASSPSSSSSRSRFAPPVPSASGV
eukprot:6088359-Prymnesium_polylepis.5